MKKVLKVLLCVLLALAVVFAAYMAIGTVVDNKRAKNELESYEGIVVSDTDQMSTAEGKKALEFAEYAEKNFKNRDCAKRSKFNECADWIISELIKAGYRESDIQKQNVKIKRFLTHNSYNIICTKQGTSDKKIVVGAHMDGEGATDNTSGLALCLYEACVLAKTDTDYTIVFVFFTGEEYGLFGSEAYVESLSKSEIDSIKCMINIDSIAAGDICYIYGGEYDEKTDEVTNTEFFNKVFNIAQGLNLNMSKSPWSEENLPPNGKLYSHSPMTLPDCSDFAAFSKVGIPYVYFEATNWNVGDYVGYTGTESCGGIMNTQKDTLEFLQKHFPGRYLDHLSRYQMLLDTVLKTGNL